MVKTSYIYTCGCGFKTTKEADAVEHVKETGHKMDVKGSVVP